MKVRKESALKLTWLNLCPLANRGECGEAADPIEVGRERPKSVRHMRGKSAPAVLPDHCQD